LALGSNDVFARRGLIVAEPLFEQVAILLNAINEQSRLPAARIAVLHLQIPKLVRKQSQTLAHVDPAIGIATLARR